ncbi:MAG: colicin immunity domain-containing protein [Actinomycetota bacterium]
MTPDDRSPPDINSYIDLIDRFLHRSVSAPDFQLTYLRMLKNERRILGEHVFLILQELFEDADRHVAEPRLRTGTEDLDDEGLMSSAARAREALRGLGYT